MINLRHAGSRPGSAQEAVRNATHCAAAAAAAAPWDEGFISDFEYLWDALRIARQENPLAEIADSQLFDDEEGMVDLQSN